MTINQEQLIKEVAEAEGTGVATVRGIVDTMGDIIFDYLSSAAPSEEITVKIWPGLALQSVFVPAHTMDYGIQAGITCPDKIRVHARIGRSYKVRLNSKDSKETDQSE